MGICRVLKRCTAPQLVVAWEYQHWEDAVSCLEGLTSSLVCWVLGGGCLEVTAVVL